MHNKSSIVIRIIIGILVVIPFFYLPQFYEHFKAYLTGTILTGLVKEQWHLVVFFALLFALFAVPLNYRKRAKWLDYGLVTAFFVSLFIEMYGIPLTVLFASKYLFEPGVIMPANVFEFDFLGVGLGMDHAMVYGAVLMILGMIVIMWGWWSLYRQTRQPGFARDGLYKISRHPQYVGFILVILGWFFGWPTILTVIFSPILIYKYIKAALAEEKDIEKMFGGEYGEYKKVTPFLI